MGQKADLASVLSNVIFASHIQCFGIRACLTKRHQC
jgi:hypothetical protein